VCGCRHPPKEAGRLVPLFLPFCSALRGGRDVRPPYDPTSRDLHSTYPAANQSNKIKTTIRINKALRDGNAVGRLVLPS
jgi:hypothetical protein